MLINPSPMERTQAPGLWLAGKVLSSCVIGYDGPGFYWSSSALCKVKKLIYSPTLGSTLIKQVSK